MNVAYKTPAKIGVTTISGNKFFVTCYPEHKTEVINFFPEKVYMVNGVISAKPLINLVEIRVSLVLKQKCLIICRPEDKDEIKKFFREKIRTITSGSNTPKVERLPTRPRH